MVRLLVAGFVFIATTSAFAQSQQILTRLLPIQAQNPTLSLTWEIEEITDGSVPNEIVVDTRGTPPGDVLPDGRVTTPEDEQDIAEAWFSEPTTRYRHAVLGDGIEAGALKIKTDRGATFTFRLPRTEVFEDISPRLADLDGDGTTEVIAILASQTGGASVAVFGLVGNAFIKKAQTPFIGRSNRWLNIAGIGRYSGSRNLEIAVIETPHLAGLFKLYQFNPNSNAMRVTRATPGFSNHQIGSRELRLSGEALLDNDSLSDLFIPSLDRRTLFGVSVARGELKLLTRISLPAAIDRAILVEGDRDETTITVGLDDGKIYKITQ